MSSETSQEERSRFIEYLFNSRNRDNIGLLLPLFLGLNQETEQNQPDRIILVNPLTQDMVVLSTNNNSESFLEKKGQPPASKASIEALPVVEIDAKVEEQCVVCLEEWKDCEKGVEMPCKHKFHKGCVEKWLNVHGSCPVCRYQMPVEEEKVNDDVAERERRRRETWVWLTFGGRRTTEESEE